MKLYEFFNVPVDKKEKQFPDYGKSKTEEEKAKMADELFWYIIDNDTLHKEHVLPFVKELKTQITSPDFNRNRFTKSWMPMVNKGCRLFYKHHKLKENPAKLFDEDFKDELCKRLCDKFVKDVQEDHYHVGDHKK
jgi:hypothetical protein